VGDERGNPPILGIEEGRSQAPWLAETPTMVVLRRGYVWGLLDTVSCPHESRDSVTQAGVSCEDGK